MREQLNAKCIPASPRTYIHSVYILYARQVVSQASRIFPRVRMRVRLVRVWPKFRFSLPEFVQTNQRAAVM